jgi:hypothetical protein
MTDTGLLVLLLVLIALYLVRQRSRMNRESID